MQTFQGLAVSDGLTVGPVVRLDRGSAGLLRIVCDPFRERALYEAAIVLAKECLLGNNLKFIEATKKELEQL